jgi:hypothetical protein
MRLSFGSGKKLSSHQKQTVARNTTLGVSFFRYSSHKSSQRGSETAKKQVLVLISANNDQLNDLRHPPIAGCTAVEADSDQGDWASRRAIRPSSTSDRQGCLCSNAWEPLDPVRNSGELGECRNVFSIQHIPGVEW